MIRIIPHSEIEQGSLRWHEMRLKHFPASEAGAVMGVNPWSPKNPRELAAYRRGDVIPGDSFPMRRGRELEDPAREALSREIGIALEPVTAVRGKFMASLDGYSTQSEVGTIVAEIKVPMNIDKLRAAILGGIDHLPRHYFWQLVHQAYCSNCDELIFSAHEFRGREHVSSERIWLFGDELRDRWPELEAAWEAFDDGDHEPIEIVRSDEEWRSAARAYTDAKAALRAAREAARIEDLEKAEKAAKETLKKLAGDGLVKTTGFGVAVTRSETPERTMKAGTRTTVSGTFEE